MDKYRLQWAGAPCGQHGSYTFYKAVKFYKNGRWRIVSLGEFFFLKFSETDPLCIGELQLLWEDRASDGLMLSSSRFYFLPESTPDGRKQNHGEDEVIAVDGKAIFKLEDLLDWVCTDVEWNRGSLAICSKDVKGGPQCNNNNGQMDDFALNNSKLNYADVKQEKKLIGDDDSKCQLKILSFPDYCRYKTVLKRLGNSPDGWLNDALVRALGGFTVPHRGTRLMYCKEEFEHSELAFHEKLCDHLAPNLKGRPRKKKFTPKEMNTHMTRRASEESIPSIPESKVDKLSIKKLKKLKHGRKHKRRKYSEVHLEDQSSNHQLDSSTKTDEKGEVKKGRKSMESHLLSYMKSRNTPIIRVPNLGFKKIDIGLFWKMGQKLGGYEAICKKKLWKKIYDKLGGSPESTSAATCTRRHYERLMLPYERHLKGLGHLPLPQSYQRPRCKDDEEDESGEDSKEDNEEEGTAEGNKMETTEDQKMSKEEYDADEEAKSREALRLKLKKRPKEKTKKLKDQLIEMREKKAQMSLQPITTKDGHLIPGLNLPPPGAAISSTKPDLTGVMADQAVLIPNVAGQIPTTVVCGIRPIPTVKSEGIEGSVRPVILTIPSLSHSQMINPLPGVIAPNSIKTEGGIVLSPDKATALFTMSHMNGMSGVISKAPIISTNTSIAAFPQSPLVSHSQSPVIMTTSQPNLCLPSSMLPLHSAMSSSIMTSSYSTRTQSSPVRGAAVTSRPSVIQHTQHARTPPFMHQPGMIHPNDLLLRQTSPRKAHTPNTQLPDNIMKQHQNDHDPIIVRPVNPYLPMLPAMPPMMLPGQMPFPASVHHPTFPLHEPPQPLNTKRRRTESGKENLDGKSATANLINIPPHQMPFFPVSVPLPVPRLVPPPSFQSLPEQDEPCDLSMPKKRKRDEERHIIRERKPDNSPLPLGKSVHGTKHGSRSSADYPSEVLHRTHKIEERHHHNLPHSRASPVGDHHRLHNMPVKMTPTPRGSITQGVINPPYNSIAKVQRDLTNSHHIKVEAPTHHIPHTSSIPSMSLDPHNKDHIPQLPPDFYNQRILAAAAANRFHSQFPLPFIPPHLLQNPAQLLANLPPNFALSNEEFLRRNAGAFLFPSPRFPPPGLVNGTVSPPQVKKEGQPSFAFHS